MNIEELIQNMSFDEYPRPTIIWEVNRKKFYYLDKQNTLQCANLESMSMNDIITDKFDKLKSNTSFVPRDRLNGMIEAGCYDYRVYQNNFSASLHYRVGMKWEDAIRDMLCRSSQIRKHRLSDRTILEQSGFPDELHKYIIDIDRNIDIYNTGFSVWIYINPNAFQTFDDQKAFVHKYQKNLITYAKLKTLANKAMSKLGDLAYYKVCEIVLTRNHSVVIKFEIKDGIRQVIESMEKEVKKRDSPDV